MFAKWTYTYFDLVALIHIAPSVDLDINELISTYDCGETGLLGTNVCGGKSKK